MRGSVRSAEAQRTIGAVATGPAWEKTPTRGTTTALPPPASRETVIMKGHMRQKRRQISGGKRSKVSTRKQNGHPERVQQSFKKIQDWIFPLAQERAKADGAASERKAQAKRESATQQEAKLKKRPATVTAKAKGKKKKKATITELIAEVPAANWPEPRKQEE
ncbi:hypothetical protein MMC18_001722 [Xylographa bjoerkii]|nr:hypothetical protein [Xylographa bjoerkii]